VRDLEVRRGGLRVKVSRDVAPVPPPIFAAMPRAAQSRAAEPAPSGAAEPPKSEYPTVNAPLTGIFYRSPSPQAAPFCQIGSIVSPGDVIGLIEAMKLFNEIRSQAAGKVRRVMAENGQLVRAHQPLIELEPL
jgi:acetyl-CoA carboxylase biotin carboxyl carrier protein